MTQNDVNTLNGALMELGETMAANLEAKGVTASASDGLTTLAGKILTIPSGGSCYHIEFSEDSYTAVGGTATLEIMLQENYAPKVGATVSVVGSDSSLYSGITNNDGIAQVIVSNVSGTVTFTCTYSNVSDTCSVTGSTYLFYDACDSSAGLTNYGSLIQLESSSYQATLGYDSIENAYKVTSIGDAKSKVFPITDLNNADNFTIEADIKRYNSRIGLAITSGTGYGYAIAISDNTKFDVWKYTNKSWSNVGATNITITEWTNLKLTVNGLSVTILATNTNGATATKTLTLDSRYTNRDIGILSASASANQYGYIKNIKAEPL